MEGRTQVLAAVRQKHQPCKVPEEGNCHWAGKGIEQDTWWGSHLEKLTYRKNNGSPWRNSRGKGNRLAFVLGDRGHQSGDGHIGSSNDDRDKRSGVQEKKRKKYSKAVEDLHLVTISTWERKRVS